jgi:hypothetical protein
MFGKYVGIVVRQSAIPYIGFVWIRQDETGDIWLDEDSSVGDGLYANEAWQVLRELFAATEYLETRMKQHG